MSIVSDLLDLMTHSIDIEAPDGTFTSRGKPNYEAAVSYDCAIQPGGNTRVRLDTGEEVKATWVIYVNTTTHINPVSRLTLPSGYAPQQPPILRVALWADEDGSHHTVIYV